MASIRQGWKTLASTGAGMSLQHMVFCLDLALRMGARPILLCKEDGSYIGSALSTPVGVLLKNNQRITAGSAESMPETIASLSQHDIGIAELIAALNLIPADRRDWIKNVTITRYHLETPRQIHNLLRRFRLSNSEQSEMLVSLRKLSFVNDYWSLRDLTNIERVASAIANNRYFDDTVPMVFNANYVFTNNIVLSSLGAFGKNAPSPFRKNRGEVIVIPHMSKSGKFFDKVKRPSGKTVKSLGLYVESLSEAGTAWMQMMNEGTMNVDQKKGELVGAFWNFPKDSPSATQLAEILMTHFGKTPSEKKAIRDKGNKRKRGDEEKEVKRVKKSRGERSEMHSLMDGLGLLLPDQGDASEEEFEEDEPAQSMDQD